MEKLLSFHPFILSFPYHFTFSKLFFFSTKYSVTVLRCYDFNAKFHALSPLWYGKSRMTWKKHPTRFWSWKTHAIITGTWILKAFNKCLYQGRQRHWPHFGLYNSTLISELIVLILGSATVKEGLRSIIYSNNMLIKVQMIKMKFLHSPQ